MVNCINKNSPDFIKLVEESGINPYVLAAKIGVWQKENGVDKFPTLEELDIKPFIKPGVTELFESNPELANAVYEAVGFKSDYNGISIELGRSADRDFGKVQNIIISYNGKSITSQDGVAGLGEMNVVIKNGEVVVGMIRLPQEHQGKGLTKYIYQAVADKLELPIVNSKLKGYNQSESGGYIWKNRTSFQPNQITPQQKQQAQQLYNSYLQTTTNPTIEGFKQWNNKQQQIGELFESNPELANAVYSAMGLNTINESEITYTDEEGKPCAKMGGRGSNFTKGSKWEIVKDLKGYPSHAQGGVDIKLGKDGFSFARGSGQIMAAHGLVLPAIKAQDGLVVGGDDDKFKLHKQQPYTPTQDNTYVALKIGMPLKQNKPEQIIPDIPILKADTRTEHQRKIDQEYTDAVLNPSIGQQLIEGGQLPLRYTANPLKFAGDLVNTVAPNSNLAKDLPNTNKERFEYRKKQLNPYTSNNEKLNNTIDEIRDLAINSLINVGTMELGFALPKSFISPAMNNMFKVGSKANFAADLLQLSKMDLDKLEDGDMEEIANLILNSASLLSKMDNFDASTIYSNIKNWKNISKIDKIDTYKDVFNLSQGINQQTQRNEE